MSEPDLRELMRQSLAARLGQEGWVLLDDDWPGDVAWLVRGLGGGIEATADVRSASGRSPLLISGVSVGVGYEPLRRLAPLLGDLLRPSVVDDDAGDLVDRREDPEALLAVSAAGDVARATDRLAALIAEHAARLAGRYPDLDALLDDLESGSLLTAALLAAAGRFDEARAVLSRYTPPPADGWLGRAERRAARQLVRWIDSGGDEDLIPAEMPPSRFASPEPPSLSEGWRRVRAVRESVDQVRRRGRGADRAELRVMLERELAARGVTEEPLWYEQTLDHIHDSPREQVQQTIRTIAGLGKLGVGVVKAIRNRELPDMSAPAWLHPPDRACYELPPGGPFVAISLDSDAGEWLDRVHSAAPRAGASAFNLEAWLEREAQSLVVHLGQRRVGVIPDADAAAYEGAIAAAEFRDELPCVRARLTRRPPPARYLLEVGS